MENLSRLPGMDAHLALAPGTRQGESLLTAQMTWPYHTQTNLLLSSRYYDHHPHSDAQINTSIGSVFGLLDRLDLSLNTNLDKQISDQARGGNLGYDIAYRDWLLSLGYTQQIYKNWVHGILEDFLASGDTRNGDLTLARMVYRSQTTRLSLSAHESYTDVRNLLDDATIRVSSYWLRKTGASIDIKRQWPTGEWQASLSGEQGFASGPAVWAGVAPHRFTIWHLYAEGSRPLGQMPLIMSLQINGQYSPDVLLSGEQYSLTASSAVPGFDADYVSAPSAASVEWKLSGKPTGKPFSPTAFVALDMGAVRSTDTTLFTRLASSSLGASLQHVHTRVSLALSVPIANISSFDPTNHYTLSGSFYWQY
jgi:hemolysin activation/secretion protein